MNGCYPHTWIRWANQESCEWGLTVSHSQHCLISAYQFPSSLLVSDQHSASLSLHAASFFDTPSVLYRKQYSSQVTTSQCPPSLNPLHLVHLLAAPVPMWHSSRPMISNQPDPLLVISQVARSFTVQHLTLTLLSAVPAHPGLSHTFPDWLVYLSNYPLTFLFLYVWVSMHHNSILYTEPTRCNFGSIVY